MISPISPPVSYDSGQNSSHSSHWKFEDQTNLGLDKMDTFLREYKSLQVCKVLLNKRRYKCEPREGQNEHVIDRFLKYGSFCTKDLIKDFRQKTWRKTYTVQFSTQMTCISAADIRLEKSTNWYKLDTFLRIQKPLDTQGSFAQDLTKANKKYYLKYFKLFLVHYS